MKIEWTFLAKNDFWQNIEYLEEHWTENDVVNFIAAVENAIALLQSQTISFQNLNIEMTLNGYS